VWCCALHPAARGDAPGYGRQAERGVDFRTTPLKAARGPDDAMAAMKRLIYASQATHDIDPDELVEILELSRRNNEAAGVSGMLLYCGQSFLQMLEGDADVLAATYDRIAGDPRHTNLRLLADLDVPGRLFPDWTMGFEHVDDEDLAEELDGFTPAINYPLVNPDLVTNAGVAQTLLTLYAKNNQG
jgi:hypothetical protein